MTAQILQQMTHEDLVSHVRVRITGPAPTATAAPVIVEDPDRASTYLRNVQVPPARIETYAKQRTTRAPRQAQFTKPAHTLLWDTLPHSVGIQAGAVEPRYEDFFRADARTLLASTA